MSLLSSMAMDVFVIPIGRDRYELYCEQPADADAPTETRRRPASSRRLRAALRADAAGGRRAAAQRRAGRTDGDKGWLSGLQDRLMAWVAERIAEQRLLWNLRRQTTAVAAHPQDMTFEQVLTLIRRHAAARLRPAPPLAGHRRLCSSDVRRPVPLMLVSRRAEPRRPTTSRFRVVGHWLSMRGASAGPAPRRRGRRGRARR